MFLRIAGVTVGVFLVALLVLAGIRHAGFRPQVSVRWADDLTAVQQFYELRRRDDSTWWPRR